MRQGIAAHQATGTQLLRPHFLALLSEGLTKASRLEEAMRVLDEALAIADRTGERNYQGELCRLKGELLLRRTISRSRSRSATSGGPEANVEPPAVAQAADYFNQSIKIAQRQKAMSLELRAAASFARLFQNHQSGKKARSLLAQIYERFSEGLDTKDLREAKALLDGLSSGGQFFHDSR
jgi:predicted ATPase